MGEDESSDEQLAHARAALRAAQTDAEIDNALRTLVNLAQTGCRPALGVVLAHVQSRRIAERAAGRMLLNPADVDEVVQSTLIICATKLAGPSVSGTYEGRGPFEGWVARIARNETNQLLGRQNRLSEPGPEPPPEHDRWATRLSSLLATEDLLKSCMTSLTDDHRTVIHLREELGLSYQEIADQLRIELNTVKTRLSRARLNLAQCLLDTDPDRDSAAE